MIPLFSWVLSASATSAFLLFPLIPSVVFPTTLPSHWASSLPLRKPQPLGSEPSPLTGRAGCLNRQHQPGPKHWAMTACCRAPIHPQHPPGPDWFRPGAEQPGRGLAGAPGPAASGLGATGSSLHPAPTPGTCTKPERLPGQGLSPPPPTAYHSAHPRPILPAVDSFC